MTNIDINELSSEQIQQIQQQLKTVKQETTTKRKEWQTLIDSMLATKSHTTVEIWQAGYDKGLIAEEPESTVGKDRTRVLKRIQARYQKLVKRGEDVGTVRMANTFAKAPVDLAAVLEWCVTASPEDLATLKDEIA